MVIPKCDAWIISDMTCMYLMAIIVYPMG
jgi:hypothetical protein